MLKKSVSFFQCVFFIVLIVCFCYSCKEDISPLNDDKESYTVAVRFPAFESTVSPLGKLGQGNPLPSALSTLFVENGQVPYLYYWSFNAGSPAPDIWLDPAATFRYNNDVQPSNFEVSGWASNGYPAGKAMAVVGVDRFIINLPLSGARKISSFGFDISSSGTGPKSFAVYYSQNVDNYKLLVDENQFSNITGSYPKNSFIYYLDTLALDYTLPLYIKLVPKAGDRGNGSGYNPQTGVIRLDNIFLTGLKREGGSSKVRQLSFHIFDAQRKHVVLVGQAPFAENAIPSLFFELPPGDYRGSFVSNDSEAELLIPPQPNADQYYVSNTFSNRLAKVYGMELDFTVRKDMEFDLLLRRYYSQVKFEFTDNRDLSTIKRIVVSQDHPPFYYAPFTKMTANPVVDQTEIVYAVDFNQDSKEILFNQFMGNVATAYPVSYTLRVYNQADKLLRTFSVSGNIKNNVRLIFRGELLDGVNANNSFAIRYQDDWDSDNTIDF